jgi:precorrin-2 dehydrogenase/sirohydrochlorin ferrochelatase
VRPFEDSDLDGAHIIIVAVDDIPLQEHIFQKCQSLGKLCNSVDSVDYCDFIFPSYIKKGDLTIAISTSGKSPAVAKGLKEFIKSKLPLDIEDFLEHIATLRNSLPKGKNRMKFLSDLASEYFKKGTYEK